MCEILTEIYPDDTADYGSNADQEEMIHVRIIKKRTWAMIKSEVLIY